MFNFRIYILTNLEQPLEQFLYFIGWDVYFLRFFLCFVVSTIVLMYWGFSLSCIFKATCLDVLSTATTPNRNNHAVTHSTSTDPIHCFFFTSLHHLSLDLPFLLTHVGLFKSLPDPDDYTFSSSNYVLILDGSSPSLLPVPIHVVTASIKAKVPIIPYSDFAYSHGESETATFNCC